MELPNTLKDWVEVVSTGGGVIGGLALFLAKNLTARQELRRKRAASGRKLITDLCDDEDVQNAFTLLDMEDGETVNLAVPKEQPLPLTWEGALHLLTDDRSDLRARNVVRDAFDALFYHFSLFHHCIDSGLVSPNDVTYPARYYIAIMKTYDWPVFERYLSRFGFDEAAAFIRECPRSGS